MVQLISLHQTKKFWIKSYGSTVLDFGAGLLSETKLLQSVGVDCVPFEPFRLTKGTADIDRDLSVDTTKKFLARVASGVEFDSIFFSAIMKHLEENRKRFQLAPQKVISTEEEVKEGAPETYEVPIAFDSSNFFA